MDNIKIILGTCPNETNAREVAAMLLEQKLAACVSILPSVRSLYRWQGKIEESEEWMILIKTGASRVEDVIREVEAVHPYEVPELITFAAEGGLSSYLGWVIEETTPAN